jgi:hypothetical protein
MSQTSVKYFFEDYLLLFPVRSTFLQHVKSVKYFLVKRLPKSP